MALEFQIYDFIEDHEIDDTDTEDDHKKLGDYIIHVFGRTEQGESVYAKITGFTPHFYISLPEEWDLLSSKDINKKLTQLKDYLLSRDNKKIWSKFKDSLIDIELIKKKKAEGFTNEKEFNFAKLIFNNSIGMKKFSYFFDNEIQIPCLFVNPIKLKLYESNLAPMLRCFHIKKIKGCGWVSTEKYRKIKKHNKNSLCSIEISVNWQNLDPIEKDLNAPFIIASFDIECYSHDGEFPQPNRKKDAIIQIGMTYTKLGENTPYRKWITCLENTDPIDNVIVESYETEQELIESWIKEVNENDCDILTGYNIFHFDEKYIYERCDKILNMKDEVGYLSKLKNRFCNFKEMKLESSALGQNLMYFWETPGRVHIDLMKDIQKTFNFTSYRLDAMLANFIRGEVKDYKKLNDNQFELTCLCVDDIELNDYIHIEIVKGFVSDDIGEKYLVIFIDKIEKKLILKGDNILESELNISSEGYKIFWSQAKDDVGPKDIFRMQKEGSKERSIVAKYCVKDCSAVNLLMNKLQVVTKNIAMANVSSVPLNYLFTRGQGIKLFSLTLKQYREDGYLFPVIKVKRDSDGNLIKIDSYEGAIVFDPVAQIDYEANTTKDYASLYPSSIMQKNMSHESEVLDSNYDNLPHITYFNASFKENDGSIKHIRYAKNKNELAVIPKILDKLMTERKTIKKLMKSEKNPFKYMILDAQQIAVKVTANSLYGQLGASTSPIANRNIAACTTSTGREMLLFAKKYDEEILPCLINSLKLAYKNNDQEQINSILNKELKDINNETLINRIKKFCIEDSSDYIFQPVIRYGDSVASYTPIYIKYNNNINICSIEDIALLYGNNNWLNYLEKEICYLENVETWTDNKWTPLLSVIRHTLDPIKKMIRIITNSGLVDVTDDHSLLVENSYKISPKDCTLETKLLHSNLPELPNNFHTEILDNLNTLYYAETQVELAYTFWILSKLNLLMEIIYDPNCESTNKYCLKIISPSKKINYQNLNKIISISEINYNGFVYDLTTENHHFAAGIGKLIVHNTDSVFCCFRFRNCCELLEYNDSLSLFKKIIEFSKELIKPFLIDNEQDLFCKLFDKYFSDKKIKDLSLPNKLKCVDISNNNKIVLPLNDRISQFLKEYIYENYYSWLWTLQEIINKNYKNIDKKLFDWAEYLLNKYNLSYNNLKEKRKTEVLPQLITIIEDYYKNESNNIIWCKPPIDFIKLFCNKIKEIFKDELVRTDVELHKYIKNFFENTLKEEWINAFDSHDAELTKAKKKLKRERTYNYKNLSELLIPLIEITLKLSFDKYKLEHENFVKNFVNNVLKNNWIQPYWISENNNYIYKMQIYNGGYPIIDKTSLSLSIELGELSGELVKSRLPFPHDLEYEKTFWPFMILTKKRYVGNKYEFDSNKYKQDYMGIVLKRRDNAPIVKEICSGIIDFLVNKKDPYGAKQFAENCLEDMFQGKYDIKYFLQSRSLKLKERYVDWTKIAHVFLSEKIALRDPGNKPQSGDRIEFAVIVPEPHSDPKKKYLQGEIIETPTFIKENNIPINYIFYMENQIMNPVLQFLELVDPNAKEIFIKMKEKYGIPKPIKEKIVKEKIIKEKVIKEKVIKEKVIKEQIVLTKIDEEPIINALKTRKPRVKKTKDTNIINIDI
jgi:DNA polymerase elongation subunit (family B)